MSASAPLARAAAAGLHPLVLPTPFVVGPVNAWLVEDDPLTLVDTGPNWGEALDALERALGEHGHRVEDLGLVVVSHQHADHLGLAEIVRRRSGAEVAALAPLVDFLGAYEQATEADDEAAAALLVEHGVPGDVVLALRASSMRRWGAGTTVTRPLRDGDELRLRDRTLRVHHRPGHSPTDLVLHDRERAILLGADHLLARIPSNPLAHRPLDGARGGLPAYLDSLAATRAMDAVELVLTGHGEPVTDHVALIDERVRGHARRAEGLLRLLAERPRTAHELAREQWGEVALTQAFLTVSQVLGHLELLAGAGRVRDAREGGVRVFAPA